MIISGGVIKTTTGPPSDQKIEVQLFPHEKLREWTDNKFRKKNNTC